LGAGIKRHFAKALLAAAIALFTSSSPERGKTL
jgi:hypothetical protein